MNKALSELKIRAKKLCKAVKQAEPDAIKRMAKYDKKSAESQNTVKLKNCQYVVAREAGFQDWQHGHVVLSGERNDNESWGTIWHSPRCDVFLNLWFANYAEAATYLAEHPTHYLLPYKHQFMVVKQDFIQALGLYDDCSSDWQLLDHDLVANYGHPSWDELARKRLFSL